MTRRIVYDTDRNPLHLVFALENAAGGNNKFSTNETERMMQNERAPERISGVVQCRDRRCESVGRTEESPYRRPVSGGISLHKRGFAAVA